MFSTLTHMEKSHKEDAGQNYSKNTLSLVFGRKKWGRVNKVIKLKR